MYDVKVLSFYGVYKKLHKNEFFLFENRNRDARENSDSFFQLIWT